MRTQPCSAKKCGKALKSQGVLAISSESDGEMTEGASPPSALISSAVAVSSPKEKNNLDLINIYIPQCTSRYFFLRKAPVALNIWRRLFLFAEVKSSSVRILFHTAFSFSDFNVNYSGHIWMQLRILAGVPELGVITPTMSWQLSAGLCAQIKCSCLFPSEGSHKPSRGRLHS